MEQSGGRRARPGRIVIPPFLYQSFQGARAALHTAAEHQDRFSRRALSLQSRRACHRTLVAIASRNARIARALLAKNETLRRLNHDRPRDCSR